MRVVIEADGGSRGNPGPAGFGCVVFSADHTTVLAEHKQFIGETTNNVAEYRGLIAGLEQARRLGANEVAVSMDSKLVVEQMSGRWKVKNPGMAELNQQARALASTFDAVTFSWIPRERNAHADRLANEAMDAAASGESGTAADPRRTRSPSRRRPGPATPAVRPACCCCATVRPSCPGSVDTPAGAILNSPTPAAGRRPTPPATWLTSAASQRSSPRRCSGPMRPPRRPRTHSD